MPPEYVDTFRAAASVNENRSQGEAEHDRQRRLFGVGAARVVALAAAVAGQILTNRWTNASALSATSSQPLSMISACPRPGIFSISVTPWLSCCCL
jgi:hypothetical protein